MNDLTTETAREHLAFLLEQCRVLILSPRREDETKCARLLESAVLLMRQIEDSNHND